MNSKKDKPFWKRIAIDFAGFGLVITSPFVGIIPGPGGLIVFFTGLSLLSLNYMWAERLLITAKSKGSSLFEMLFPQTNKFKAFFDVLTLALLSFGGWAFFTQDNKWSKAVSTATMFLGITLFILNRSRLESITNKIRRNKH
ncbi:MAG: PGPGW domain-containing protein [bacterium]|nr:PGPGW domain-containing protein [bacterium]